ncbi:DUF2933 domain-containing protein [Cupriavidus necator]|uniref:DUF2933 domain-containing protein n=1 Tax=Cupriavidus necator TaxID=106590 RepID=UPI003ED073B8
MKTMIAAGVALVAILAAAYAVWPPVRALVLGLGPYLLLLACPLSMWLMMKSMSAHDDQVSSMTEVGKSISRLRFRAKSDGTAGGHWARVADPCLGRQRK